MLPLQIAPSGTFAKPIEERGGHLDHGGTEFKIGSAQVLSKAVNGCISTESRRMVISLIAWLLVMNRGSRPAALDGVKECD